MTVDLSVVLPCLNEQATVGRCVQEAARSIQMLDLVGEVIVVDNGSTDDSASVARDFGARVLACDVKGYGAALRCGLDAARGHWLIMADSDGTYDLCSLGQFLAPLQRGIDLVVGNRFTGGIERGAMPWLHRYLGNPALTTLVNLLFHAQVGDIHCGMRALTRTAYDRIRPRSVGMEYASEMLINAILARLIIEELPTRLRCDVSGRIPHLRTFRDGWRHLSTIVALRYRFSSER